MDNERLQKIQALVNELGFRRKEFAAAVFTQCHNTTDTVCQTVRTAVELVNSPHISDDELDALTQQVVKKIKVNSTPRTVIQDIDLTFVGVGSKTDMVAVVTLVQTKPDAERIQQLNEEYFANEDRENYCGVDRFLESKLNKEQERTMMEFNDTEKEELAIALVLLKKFMYSRDDCPTQISPRATVAGLATKLGVLELVQRFENSVG